MESLRFLFGVILPYVAVIVFLLGMIWRFLTWKKLASPPMTLFPASTSGGSPTLNTIKESVFFSSLFKGDRLLWIIAWIFHLVLVLIILGHLRVFTNIDQLLMSLGMSEDAILAMSTGAGGAAGVIILAATVLLLVRRLAIPRVREITGFADYLALLLIGAIIITGNIMRFGPEHFDLVLTREYFADLATFRNFTDIAALQNGTFVLHMSLAFLLIMCMPFSKLLHFGGIFFTHQLIRK